METGFPTDPFEAQRKLLAGLDKSKITIFDVGANKGLTASKYRSHFPFAEIYCFEPFPRSVDALRRCFESDKLVSIVDKAVAETSGTMAFHLTESDSTHSLFPRCTSARRYYSAKRGSKGVIDVDVIALDQFVSERMIPHVEIIKLDVQGGELRALRGAKSLLDNARVQLIYTEMMFVPHYESAPHFFEICSFLSEVGYSLFDVYNLRRASNGQLRFGDAIFVNDELRKAVIDQFPEEP